MLIFREISRIVENREKHFCSYAGYFFYKNREVGKKNLPYPNLTFIGPFNSSCNSDFVEMINFFFNKWQISRSTFQIWNYFTFKDLLEIWKLRIILSVRMRFIAIKTNFLENSDEFYYTVCRCLFICQLCSTQSSKVNKKNITSSIQRILNSVVLLYEIVMILFLTCIL